MINLYKFQIHLPLNFFHKICPSFMNEIYHNAHQSNISTKQPYYELKQPLRRTNSDQKPLS